MPDIINKKSITITTTKHHKQKSIIITNARHQKQKVNDHN